MSVKTRRDMTMSLREAEWLKSARLDQLSAVIEFLRAERQNAADLDDQEGSLFFSSLLGFYNQAASIKAFDKERF